MGPVYLMWGKKRAKSDKGKPIKKYYIKGEEKHYIWVKWKNPFSDKPDIVWSAEPQCKYFIQKNTKENSIPIWTRRLLNTYIPINTICIFKARGSISIYFS